jgi:molybdopterin-containing oxidoreductase family iron-sulfur binding subunit
MTAGRIRNSNSPDRRQALALLSSAVALGLSGCVEPQEEIVPYVDMPEGLVPGVPLRFATALALAGYGRGMLGVTVDGRPIKIEGNPRHPYSLGATDVFSEAEVLSLYDPDRSRIPLREGQVASWQEFQTEWTHLLDTPANRNGSGMALVTGRITSPAMLRAVAILKTRFPELRHFRYEPVNDDRARAGARQAFGRPIESIPRLSDADIVITLDSDPLGPGPSQLRHARGFSERRSGGKPQRLYAVESGWTLTGACADHRLALRSDRASEIARAIAAGFGLDLGQPALTDAEQDFARATIADLMRGQTRGLILAGETQSPAVHALCHWLNAKLNAPVDYVPPADPEADDHEASFSALLTAIDRKEIRTLLVLDANPVYDCAASSHVADAIAALPFSIHCGLYRDETAEPCRWHLPLSHGLESWGDIRSPDGTTAFIQPLIRPLYDTRTAQEFIVLLAGGNARSARDLTRETWRDSVANDFEIWWRRALVEGIVPGSAPAPVAVTARMPVLPAPPQLSNALSLTILPHPALWDGRYANNAWLQECPAPFTKEVWGNAVHMSPQDAAALDIAHGDAVTLRRGETAVDAVAAVLNGHPPGMLQAFHGQGRWRAGAIGSGIGSRIAALGETGTEPRLEGVTIGKSTADLTLFTTQTHTRLEGRDEDLFPLASVADIANRLAALEPARRGILGPLPANEYAWAMVIDNDRCIGCNACVIACQAENNVGVVGPEEIALGRDMHWLRIDAYEIDSPSAVRRGFQPIPCMHCETAPCEPVCPVAASVHDHEGLNVQVYNRCIGTRFCEANCPYKVRRFNFFGYTRGQEYGNLGQPPVNAQRNPNVSVRGRGVMEKCTYCVQRISAARRQAEKENRTIAEGEVVTACQAACPTRAIHFGNRNSNASDVARLQSDKRHYALLGHLDTRPRTTYLAKVFNSNPDLDEASR